MAKNFKILQAKMPAAARARSENELTRMIQEMALDELREALDLTQEHLAEVLQVNQAAVSKVERRSDMYISTLRKIIEAMGGRLDIRAVLPNGVVRINQFEDVRKPAAAGAPALVPNPDAAHGQLREFPQSQFIPWPGFCIEADCPLIPYSRRSRSCGVPFTARFTKFIGYSPRMICTACSEVCWRMMA